MPKKPPRNGYYYFAQDFKKSEAKRGITYANLADAMTAASPHWAALTSEQKDFYTKIAKDERGPGKSLLAKKFTSQGETLEYIEKRDQEKSLAEERERDDIARMVNPKGAPSQTIQEDVFFIIDVNTYCRTPLLFVPCEVSIVAFNLSNGIIQVYHTFPDPGGIPIGYMSDAKESFADHNIPVPPLEYGQSDYIMLLSEIIDFMKHHSDTRSKTLFAMPQNIEAVKSFIEQLCDKSNEDPNIFKIYRLDLLFYNIKQSIQKMPGDAFPKDTLALRELMKDGYKYTEDICCEMHQETDVFHNCSKARAKRMAFTILDHCCQILDIELIPGRHIPFKADIKKKVHMPSVENNDRETKRKNFKPVTLVSSSEAVKYAAGARAVRSPHDQHQIKLLAEDDQQFPALPGRGRGRLHHS